MLSSKIVNSENTKMLLFENMSLSMVFSLDSSRVPEADVKCKVISFSRKIQ